MYKEIVFFRKGRGVRGNRRFPGREGASGETVGFLEGKGRPGKP